MPPSPVAETATDLTDDTVASSTASAATSKQGLGSAELATTRKHKKCQGKPIKAGHTPPTEKQGVADGTSTTDGSVWAASVIHETMEHCHAVPPYCTGKRSKRYSQPAATDL